MSEGKVRACVVCGESMNFEGASALIRSEDALRSRRSTEVQFFSCRCGRTESNEVELVDEPLSNNSKIVVLHR